MIILDKICPSIFDPLKTLLMLLKIEHKGLTIDFAYISKTVNFSQILTKGKSDQHDEIYLW